MHNAESTAQSRQIIGLLKEYWPEHARLLGDPALERAAQSAVAGKKPINPISREDDSGTPFDLKTTLEVVSEALAFLRLGFEVYKYLAERSREKPTAAELSHGLAERTKDPGVASLISTDRGQKAIASIVKVGGGAEGPNN